MPIIIVGKTGRNVVVFRGEAEGVFGDEVAVGDAGGAGSAGDGAEGCVVVMRGDAVLESVVEDLGDVLVAVVSVKEVEAPVLGAHDERARGDGLGWIPHELGADGVVVGGVQPLDAEVVVVDEALKGFLAILHRAHFDTAPHAVEGHRDHGATGLPADGAVFGIVDYRPNAGLGFDEGLVAVCVVLGDEVVDGGVLIEVVGGVGFALGGGTISDVIVGVGDLIRGDEFIADVVAVLLVVLGGAAAEEVVGNIYVYICVEKRTEIRHKSLPMNKCALSI